MLYRDSKACFTLLLFVGFFWVLGFFGGGGGGFLGVFFFGCLLVWVLGFFGWLVSWKYKSDLFIIFSVVALCPEILKAGMGRLSHPSFL